MGLTYGGGLWRLGRRRASAAGDRWADAFDAAVADLLARFRSRLLAAALSDRRSGWRTGTVAAVRAQPAFGVRPGGPADARGRISHLRFTGETLARVRRIGDSRERDGRVVRMAEIEEPAVAHRWPGDFSSGGKQTGPGPSIRVSSHLHASPFRPG